MFWKSGVSVTNTVELNQIAESLMEYHGRLLALAKRNLNPILLRRVTPEEVVQDTLSAACEKVTFMNEHPEVPTYFKLRTLLFQTIGGLERKHLQSQKRDAYKEVLLVETERLNDEEGGAPWARVVDSATGPLTRMSRMDRYELLKQAMANLSENDRQILELRHFDDLSNLECADVLHITPKNASIRYIRALERLQKGLAEFTEFRS